MAGRSVSACLNSAQLGGKGDNDSRVVPALPTATLVPLLVRAQGTCGQVYGQLLMVVYSCLFNTDLLHMCYVPHSVRDMTEERVGKTK